MPRCARCDSRRRNIDALLVDQMEPAGGAVADHLGIPFITVCNALAINRDPIAPPAFSSVDISRDALGAPPQCDRLRRLRLVDAANYARRCRLPRAVEAAAARSPDDSFSRLCADLPDAARI